MHKVLGFISLLALSGVAHAATLDYKKTAICDRKARYCADHQGVSVALTKMYLGDKAEARLMSKIRAVGLDNFDAGTFTMSSGLTCKVPERTCWTNRSGDSVDRKATRILFGKLR